MPSLDTGPFICQWSCCLRINAASIFWQRTHCLNHSSASDTLIFYPFKCKHYLPMEAAGNAYHAHTTKKATSDWRNEWSSHAALSGLLNQRRNWPFSNVFLGPYPLNLFCSRWHQRYQAKQLIYRSSWGETGFKMHGGKNGHLSLSLICKLHKLAIKQGFMTPREMCFIGFSIPIPTHKAASGLSQPSATYPFLSSTQYQKPLSVSFTEVTNLAFINTK